ncbi:MAG: hypothetical protein P8X58_00400 [Syntrophobacterales bacterium]
MSPPEQTKPSPPSSGDDIIELTEVVEQAAEEVPADANTEVVQDFRGGDDLESLKSQVKTPEADPETSPMIRMSPSRRLPSKARQPRTHARSWLNA